MTAFVNGSLVFPDRVVTRQTLPVRDGRGQITQLAGVSEDVTDRRQAEAARADSEDRLRAFLENSAVIAWLCGVFFQTAYSAAWHFMQASDPTNFSPGN
jgi:PAS domain-containing protein